MFDVADLQSFAALVDLLMTQTIYVRRCDLGWAGLPSLLGVAGRWSLISPGVAGHGARRPPATLPTLLISGSMSLIGKGAPGQVRS